MFKHALIAMMLAAFAAGGATADENPAGAMTSRDGRLTFVTRPDGNANTPHHFVVPRGATIIYSNLNEKYADGTYAYCAGWTVSGPASQVGQQFWLAAAFTPAVNATATKLALGLQVISGTNALVVTLNADNNDSPGAVLARKTITNIPASGACCTLMDIAVKGGVALTAGSQYWVTVSTTSSGTDTWAGWQNNTTEQIHSQVGASDFGSGWQTGILMPGVALAVYGR